ncbi:MAG: septum formation initiator family protein [Clostridiaceae bacterium]|nr:septum formation initiator family protein [Clostridiaceae bacterium]
MNKRRRLKWGLLAIIALSVYFLFIIIDQQSIIDAKEEEIKNIQAKINEELNTNKKLLEQKEMLGSDEYIEQVAREELGMVKPGEKIYIDIE